MTIAEMKAKMEQLAQQMSAWQKQAEQERKEKEQERKEKEQERKEKEQERKEKEQAQKQAEQERKEKEQLVADQPRSVMTSGFPPIQRGPGQSTYQPNPQRPNHSACKAITTKHFVAEQVPAVAKNVGKALWESTKNNLSNGTALIYNTEAELISYTKLGYEEIIAACGNASNVAVVSELCMLSIRPDISVLFKNGKCCGVVEVVKPLLEGNDDAKVAHIKKKTAQIFDYLVFICSIFGVPHDEAYGIVTDYERTCIAWLPPNKYHSPTQAEELWSLEDVVNTRELVLSQVLKHDDPELIAALSTVFLRMSQVNHGVVIDGKNGPLPNAHVFLVCKIGDGNVFWEGKKANSITFDDTLFLPNNLLQSKIYAIRHLGGGRDGTVWKCCLLNGNIFALKFHLPSKQDTAAREAACWNELYGADEDIIPRQARVYVVDTWNQVGVVMPYFDPLQKSDAATEKVLAVLRAKFTAKHKYHPDIKWDNVAQTRNGDAVILDLVGIQDLPHGTDPEAEYRQNLQ
jgi:hypothetical protein